MDTRTGELMSWNEAKDRMKENPGEAKYFKPANHVTPRQLKRRKIGRNEPCPCGSGKKFKRCCITGAIL